MSTHSSDNVPEQSQGSPLDYQGVISQGKRIFKQVWTNFALKFPLTSRRSSDPALEKQRKLQEIGNYIRQIRQKKGLSLGAIAQDTHIPEPLLHSLEMGDLTSLPEPVYIRAMIKRVGAILEINGTELAGYLTEEGKTAVNRPTFQFKLPSLNLRPVHFYFLYLLLVILSVRGLSNMLREAALQGRGETFPLPRNASPVVEKETLPPSPQPSLTPSPVVKPMTVTVQTKEATHIRVTTDGKVAFEGVLPQGTKRTFQGKERITVRADDGGRVMVGLNQSEPKILGEKRQIQEVTYRNSQKEKAR